MNPEHALHKLRSLLPSLSDNNKDEQEAIHGYYELESKIHYAREEHRFWWNVETNMTEDLDEISDEADSEEKAMARARWKVIKAFLDKAEAVVRKNIAEEKKHSLDLNSLAQELDGIAPELN